MTRPQTLLSIAHSYVVALNRRLAHEMARAGNGRWQVTAVAPRVFHGSNDLRSIPLEPAVQEACQVVPVSAYLTRYVHFFTYSPRLRSILNRNWSLVHCWEEPFVVAGGQVAWWTPRETPLVYRTAQSLPKTYPPPFRWIERYAMRRAAGWICSGRLVAENLRRLPVYATRPMALIPLGVDLDFHRPDPVAGRAVREALGWDVSGPPVVGYLGRFVPEKGLPLLMRVLDRLEVPWRTLLVGGGALEAELRSWAARHGDRVRICTGVTHDAVPAYLNAMDLLCAPSQTTHQWREQFGRMITEAFACGVPAVGSDSGEIPHLIKTTGEVVGEHDEAGWQRVLTDLLEQPARRQELAAHGLERARTEFAWPIIARQYLDFFDQILEHRQGGPHRATRSYELTSVSHYL